MPGSRFRGSVGTAGGIAGAVLLAGLALLPAGALASTMSKSTRLRPRETATLTAERPRGERATGGGWAFHLPGALRKPPAGHVVVQESRKIHQRGWRVTGLRWDGRRHDRDAVLTARVYCSEHAPKTEAIRSTELVEPEKLSS